MEEKHPTTANEGSCPKAVARRFVVAALLIAASIGACAFFSAHSGVFPTYRTFSQLVLGALSSLSSCVPFALWDVFLVLLIVCFAVGLVAVIRRRRLCSFLSWLAALCLAAALLFTGMVVAWGLNHYAPPLSEELGLEVGEYTGEELAQTTEALFKKAVELAPQQEREEDGTLKRQDFDDLAAVAGASYRKLAQEHDVFKGSDKPVKKLTVMGRFLLMTGHNGIICPITGEASVPADCAVMDMPFTMAHEAAHRCGIASEQEANFAAFLACSSNGDIRLQYSAYCQAFRYCYSALASNYPSKAKKLLRAHAQKGHDGNFALKDDYALVVKDANDTSAYYAQFEGPLEEAGTAANDAYLKAFSEPEGVRSYGLVVDYLIAWHQEQRS